MTIDVSLLNIGIIVIASRTLLPWSINPFNYQIDLNVSGSHLAWCIINNAITFFPGFIWI